jgi:general secretion pathway protein L
MIIQVIQLTEHDLTCARFQRSGRATLTPLSGFKLPYADHAELREHLREQLPTPGAEEVRTILALPPALVALRELNLPIIDRRKLRAVLPLELSSETTQPEQELVCDAVPLDEGNVLAGWAPRAVVAELIALLADVGAEPEAVTVACLHWQLLAPDQQTGPFAICDRQAVLVCRPATSAPAYCRSLGSDNGELGRTLTALELARDLPVRTVYQLDPDGPVELPDSIVIEPLPVPALLVETQASGSLPPLALASALAVAEAYCCNTLFNLRSGSLAWSHQRYQLLRRHRLPLLLAVVLLVLLVVESGTRWYLLKRDLASLNGSIARIYREVFPTRTKAVDEVAEIKAEIRRLQGGISGNSSLAFLSELAAMKGDEITLLSEVEYDGSRLRLKGDSRSSAAVNGLRQQLIAAGWAVEQADLTSRPDGSVLFTLKGQRGGTTP